MGRAPLCYTPGELEGQHKASDALKEFVSGRHLRRLDMREEGEAVPGQDFASQGLISLDTHTNMRLKILMANREIPAKETELKNPDGPRQGETPDEDKISVPRHPWETGFWSKFSDGSGTGWFEQMTELFTDRAVLLHLLYPTNENYWRKSSFEFHSPGALGRASGPVPAPPIPKDSPITMSLSKACKKFLMSYDGTSGFLMSWDKFRGTNSDLSSKTRLKIWICQSMALGYFLDYGGEDKVRGGDKPHKWQIDMAKQVLWQMRHTAESYLWHDDAKEGQEEEGAHPENQCSRATKFGWVPDPEAYLRQKLGLEFFTEWQTMSREWKDAKSIREIPIHDYRELKEPKAYQVYDPSVGRYVQRWREGPYVPPRFRQSGAGGFQGFKYRFIEPYFRSMRSFYNELINPESFSGSYKMSKAAAALRQIDLDFSSGRWHINRPEISAPIGFDNGPPSHRGISPEKFFGEEAPEYERNSLSGEVILHLHTHLPDAEGTGPDGSTELEFITNVEGCFHFWLRTSLAIWLDEASRKVGPAMAPDAFPEAFAENDNEIFWPPSAEIRVPLKYVKDFSARDDVAVPVLVDTAVKIYDSDGDHPAEVDRLVTKVDLFPKEEQRRIKNAFRRFVAPYHARKQQHELYRETIRQRAERFVKEFQPRSPSLAASSIFTSADVLLSTGMKWLKKALPLSPSPLPVFAEDVVGPVPGPGAARGVDVECLTQLEDYFTKTGQAGYDLLQKPTIDAIKKEKGTLAKLQADFATKGVEAYKNFFNLLRKKEHFLVESYAEVGGGDDVSVARLTTRPLALVAEWLSRSQHKACIVVLPPGMSLRTPNFRRAQSIRQDVPVTYAPPG